MTLCFLGAVHDACLAPLIEQAGQIRSEPFTLQFDRLQTWSRARVLTTNDPAPAAAIALVHALQRCARTTGLTAEQKLWRPHLTLARGVTHADSLQVAPIALRLHDFHLAQSLPLAERRYQSLARWPLRA